MKRETPSRGLPRERDPVIAHKAHGIWHSPDHAQEAVDEAEQHFNTGLEWASRPDVRFGVDAGRCHQASPTSRSVVATSRPT